MTVSLSRRELLKRSAFVGAGGLVAGNLDHFLQLGAAAAHGARGLGPLVPDPDGILDLPRGFSYRVISTKGRPLASGGGLVPGSFDAMGAFRGPRHSTLLVRNHEQGTTGDPAVVAPPSLVYDPGAVGGTTTLAVDRYGDVLEEYVSLGGTVSNCAGGVTPWGSWLTCEETEAKAGGALQKSHGWVFEVDAYDSARNAAPTPLTGLGRFPHEAAIIDPERGDVYLTEDASRPNGLLYRFEPSARPSSYGDLRGPGTLHAMYVPGVDDLAPYTEIGTQLRVEWTRVPDPSAALVSTRKQFTYRDFTTGVLIEGPGGPVTRSRKFEGAWWDDEEERAFIVTSFARGAADWSTGEHDGQVWSYDPRRSRLRLEARFARATDPDSQPDGPDNITVSPYGGLLLAEDGEGVQHLLSVDERGRSTPFARNRVSDSEFAGVVFAPDRETMFANLQGDGLTFAITGPFGRPRDDI